MAKTSINIQPVKAGSEEHNLRIKQYDYVRQDLSYLNGAYIKERISPALERIKNNYQKSTGQKMQKKATPIREGVVLIKQEHTPDDLVKLGKKLEDRFGIKLIQAFTHKDEGHWDKGIWKPNFHGHMVFDWTDEKGRTIKLNRYEMSAMQTIVAEALEMERGISSNKQHLSAVSFKVQEEEKRLKNLKEELKDCLDIGEAELIQYKENNILNIFSKNKEIDTQATLSNYKKSLQSAKIALREKEKELNLLQNAFLSSQKEIEKLKKQNKNIEKHLQESKNKEKLLLSNHSYYNSVRTGLIQLSSQNIIENYKIEIHKKLLNFHRENHRFLPIYSGLFQKLAKDIKESLCDRIGLEDDLKKEVLEEINRQIQEKKINDELYLNIQNTIQKEKELEKIQKQDKPFKRRL